MATRPKAPREGEEDFEAFWVRHRGKKTPKVQRILGVDVRVPTEVPLSFEDTFARLAGSAKPEDYEQVLTVLFGDGTIDKLKAKGLTSAQLQFLMSWAYLNASGREVTFAEAAELVDDAEQAMAGKAGNRATRRASSRTAASARAGRTSSRTSAANTGSQRSS